LVAIEAAVRVEDGADDAVFNAVRELGPTALRPDPWERDDAQGPNLEAERAALGRIRVLIWSHVDGWYAAARRAGTPEQRKAAADRLRRLGSVLVGDRRGLRRSTVRDPQAVRRAYRLNLERLREALHRLARPGSGPREVRIRRIAEECGLPFERLRDHVLDTDGQPHRPEMVKRTARIWTAQDFGITEQTVANILASAPYRRK
jgi:hypothetical protein